MNENFRQELNAIRMALESLTSRMDDACTDPETAWEEIRKPMTDAAYSMEMLERVLHILPFQEVAK